jgi:hypothetical protein
MPNPTLKTQLTSELASQPPMTTLILAALCLSLFIAVGLATGHFISDDARAESPVDGSTAPTTDDDGKDDRRGSFGS